jgi:hypothetical protein
LGKIGGVRFGKEMHDEASGRDAHNKTVNKNIIPLSVIVHTLKLEYRLGVSPGLLAGV